MSFSQAWSQFAPAACILFISPGTKQSWPSLPESFMAHIVAGDVELRTGFLKVEISPCHAHECSVFFFYYQTSYCYWGLETKGEILRVWLLMQYIMRLYNFLLTVLNKELLLSHKYIFSIFILWKESEKIVLIVNSENSFHFSGVSSISREL